MKIKQKFSYIDGSFDTKDTDMVCVKSHKYKEVELCVKSNKNKGGNIPIAKIKLYSRDLYVDAKEVYEYACKLGEEIARRWNECNDKK